MPVSNPKCRMVSFRLSAAEYSSAEEVCRAQGYRSLSLFARSAIMAFIPNGQNNGHSPTLSLQELRDRVEFLAAELQRLSECISNQKGIDANGVLELFP